MFPEVDGLGGEFGRALRLLHSPEPGSAEALRGLLDAWIARREATRDPAGFTDALGNSVAGKDEVPRISIPDEGPGPVCKVCSVPEFGPLVLIGCQRCGELYHPLCHQPAVVDAPLADLRWRCSECDRTSAQEDASRDTTDLNGSILNSVDGVKPRSKKVGKRAKKLDCHKG